MKHRIALMSVMLVLPLMLSAQWRLGVSGGAMWNHYSVDKQYQTDYHYVDQWGGTAGVHTQYNFLNWLGVRAGVYFAQRNYRHTRYQYADLLNMRYENNYLLFPVTVSFSFGGEKVRGYVNAGVYGGAWLGSLRSGTEFNAIGYDTYTIDKQAVPMMAERDNRGDFGYTGGVGIEYRFHEHWMAQVEAVCYYSVVSATKQYMTHQKDYRYHTSVGLQAGISYLF